MSQDILVLLDFVLLNFPQALIEFELGCDFSPELLQNHFLAPGGENPVVGCVSEIDNIMLNQLIIHQILCVQFEFPWHGCICLLELLILAVLQIGIRQVHEVTHCFVSFGLHAGCFDWDFVGFVSLDGCFLQIDI